VSKPLPSLASSSASDRVRWDATRYVRWLAGRGEHRGEHCGKRNCERAGQFDNASEHNGLVKAQGMDVMEPDTT
jgi:hypothetical protein